ncbi:hypothetical protein AQS8620_01373 [Aquimixticola soesokkakensis]|uniref:DUF3572 domain-containing protein n=1 Tax=Aquimixticola soesokkakensis TaxID=1519096 RepID=A0A1Y5SC85_9RHOB|nr:DUF3572 domain-containing protein [Aquimixticola soesokkakensis]SLN37450.1 hypothetical protein AQS8620_01373 [Aquimixticola soesokkakensis]
MQQETAETIGLQALGWLAGNEELLPVFMGSSGASIEDLRSRALEPEFLGAVLEFILMNDDWVRDFCRATGQASDAPMRARLALPGGAEFHWT